MTPRASGCVTFRGTPKVGFGRRSAARRALRLMGAQPKDEYKRSVYRCSVCRSYHIGNALRKGLA